MADFLPSAMIMAMDVIIGVVFFLLAAGGGFALRNRRDEVFDGLTPGLLPASGQQVHRRRVRQSQKPPVAVRFDRPGDFGPGLGGFAIDGRVDPVELSATLIDLGQRGWLTLRPLSLKPGMKPYDWQLDAAPQPPNDSLSVSEQHLLSAAFGQAPSIRLSAFRTQPGVKAASEALLKEAHDRRWLRTMLPTLPSLLTLISVVLVIFGLMALLSHPAIGVGMALGGIALFAFTRKLPEPLTAEGSAARAQCEGFKLYLATAEAEQLKFEVSIDTFGRYLPWAMVFGVVDHWRSVFSAALRADPSQQLDGFDWLALGDGLDALLILDLLSVDFGVFDSLVSDFGNFAELPGIDGIGDALGSIADGVDLDIFSGFD